MQQSERHIYVQEVVLITHLDLLNQYLGLILQTPEFYYIELPYLFFGASPIGRRKVFLGDILQLWRNASAWKNHATTRVELIDGWSRGRKKQHDNLKGFYVLNTAGSALSGANNTLAWDISEQKLIHVMLPSMFILLKDLEAIYPYRPRKLSNQNDDVRSINDLIELLKMH